MKKGVGAFLKEISTIIVGILVALFINDWNDDRKDKAYLGQIFLSIQKELRETNEDISSTIIMQQSFVDTLDRYMNNDTISLSQVVLKAKGFYMPTIKISSWKAISNSRIELVDYDKLSTLGNIEEQKKMLNTQGEKLIDYFYLNSEETGKEKKEVMEISMLSIMGMEKALQENIETIISD